MVQKNNSHAFLGRCATIILGCGILATGFGLAGCGKLALSPSTHPIAGSENESIGGEMRFLSGTRQLTFDGARSGEGYFSADGSMLVFQSEREPNNPFYQIYLMDMKTGESSRMSPGIGRTTCAWVHPGKSRVLFASTHLDPNALQKQEEEYERRRTGGQASYAWDFDDQYDLFETDTQGRILRQLTSEPGYDAEASWSPDGSKIAFASNRSGFDPTMSDEDRARFAQNPSGWMDIYIMNADGSNVQRLTTEPGYDGGPFFSADGKKITWRHFAEDGSTAEVWTMNIDGTEKRQLTRLGKMSWAPYFHPSGDYLIFASNIEGHRNFELYVVDSAGMKEPVRVTWTDGFDGLPVFSPDGRKLAWTSNRTPGKESQIFIADWNDAAARTALGLTVSKPNFRAFTPAIRRRDLERHVQYLSSPALAGRLTGTDGERAATEYGAEFFRFLGLEPAGDNGSYFQNFEFTAGVSAGSDNNLAVQSTDASQQLVIDSDWRPLAFSADLEFRDEPVVFAGYGIVAPAADNRQTDDDSSGYDSYVHLDVKDRWVLVFRFLPENLSVARKQYLNRFASLRQKAMVARERGAKGIIFVHGPNAGVGDQLIPLRMDASAARMSIGGMTVTNRVAEVLLAGSGHTLKSLQDTLDQGEMIQGFELGSAVSGQTQVVQETRIGRNVIARLPSPVSGNGSVLIGAHVDHLGGDAVSGIYSGADDNASGVASVLEIAQNLAYLKRTNQAWRRQLQRDVVFALWSGEELGLIGSAHYAKTLAAQRSGGLYPYLAAALNLDMVGRLKDSLTLQSVGASPLWPALIEAASLQHSVAVTTQDDPWLPTDSTSFYLQGVPTLNAFTGSHDDYHTPGDTYDKLNYTGMERIAAFMADILVRVAQSADAPPFNPVKDPNSGGSGGGFKAYLGTIPDYSNTTAAGVLLSGVKSDSPADQAGLRAGDIIVFLAGQKIENIYDYTAVLGVLRIGEAVEIQVMRDGNILSFSVVPGSRS